MIPKLLVLGSSYDEDLDNTKKYMKTLYFFCHNLLSYLLTLLTQDKKKVKIFGRDIILFNFYIIINKYGMFIIKSNQRTQSLTTMVFNLFMVIMYKYYT